LRSKLAEAPELGATLIRLISTCEAEWPGIRQSPSEFIVHLAERLDPKSADVFERLRITDLYLAFACARGDPHAINAFEARYCPTIDRALRHLPASPDQKTEIKQTLRAEFFAGSKGAAPTIASYSGRGALSGWVRRVAIRAGWKLIQRSRWEVCGNDELLAALPNSGHGPEVEYLKAKYLPKFEQALKTAVDSLDCRQRVLLRLNYVDELSIDKIGRLYDVHRSTAARWIQKARDSLGSHARRALGGRLRIAGEDYGSILDLIANDVSLSLSRYLVSHPSRAIGPLEPHHRTIRKEPSNLDQLRRSSGLER
jgi:RNA polymerase sigma-70 factor (ECF subfamily)